MIRELHDLGDGDLVGPVRIAGALQQPEDTCTEQQGDHQNWNQDASTPDFVGNAHSGQRGD